MGGEQHGGDEPHRLRKPFRQAVDPRRLRRQQAVQPLPPDDEHLDLERAGLGLRLAGDAGGGGYLGPGVAPDKLRLRLGVDVAHRRQEVDGLQEVRLPLGVIADEYAGAGRQAEVEVVEVAVVGQVETKEPHKPIIAYG
ncbi:MAG: hypothetical protein HYS09_07795 [Chloroflexi bacterium]|nr:hypothetical protein [Chloroflexota bacterium]